MVGALVDGYAGHAITLQITPPRRLSYLEEPGGAALFDVGKSGQIGGSKIRSKTNARPLLERPHFEEWVIISDHAVGEGSIFLETVLVNLYGIPIYSYFPQRIEKALRWKAVVATQEVLAMVNAPHFSVRNTTKTTPRNLQPSNYPP